ncbi:MAG: hypothetical protein K9N06_10975 [Candidatus Cloacimonetes bacterium]|nr:hypothetical protein [Candidatus Cloacimonadota bacterium]
MREQFTKELRYYRSRTASAILIVMIDGDLKSIQERIEKLKRECDVENIEFRKNDEKVLIVVPARNIETWVYFLQGNKVDDRADYKRKVSDKDCKNTAKKLVEMCDNKEPLTGCPSLIAACEEYRSVFLSN